MNKIVDGLDGLDGLRSTECCGMRLYRKKRMSGMNAMKSTTLLLIELENWWLWFGGWQMVLVWFSLIDHDIFTN